MTESVVRSVAIIGAGGHAEVVASTLRAAGHVVGEYYADAPEKWGTSINGVPIVGPVADAGRTSCSHAIIGIGDNAARKRIAGELDLDWITVVHPFSSVHPDVPIGPGTVVCAGSIIQVGASVGAHVIINTKASVDHHCRVGDFSHIAVAHLAGGASIGEGVFMALGCIVLPKLRVGDWSTVGAGSVVTRDVAAGITVVGMPARPVPSRSVS